MGKRDLMKTIYLLIFLVLAGTAWGADWQNCGNSGAICDNNGKCTCLGESVKQKGHCPHCGAKSLVDEMGLQVIKGGEVLWTIRRCPNGHLWWERE